MSVGRYLILETIGSGGMGEILAAFDDELDRKVALKILHPESARPGGKAQLRLVREAQAMARLSHPNVVAVYDAGTHDGRVFVAMELVDGVTLGTWLTSAPRRPREIVDVFLAAGRGLAAAHAAGLVHRDFKPDNVLVGKDGRARVTDFGLVRATDVDGDHTDADVEPRPPFDSSDSHVSAISALDTPLTQAGISMGTPRYMSPEQHEARDTDARTDQFSFCVALYHALYGQRPFAGRSRDELLDAIASGRVREPPKASHVPSRLRRVLLRGLAADREQRYPSMDALLADLARDPAAAWRTRAGWILGLALLVALPIVYRQASRREPAVCLGAETALTGVWDPPRRAAVEAAFRNTKLTYADDTLERVVRGLDEYTRGWTAARTGACQETRQRGEHSEEVMSLRLACLDRQLGQARALVDALAAADAKVVEKAVAAVESLERSDRCGPAIVLRDRRAPPDDRDARTKLLAAQLDLAQADAAIATGHAADGVDAARRALAVALAVGYRPLQAQARSRLGTLLLHQGEFAPAERELQQALLDAVAVGDDEEAARAAMRLVTTVGSELARPAEAEHFARYARAALDRVGGSDLISARLHEATGIVHYSQGKYADARTSFEQAHAAMKATLGPDSPETINVLSNLAAALTFTGDATSGLELTRQVVAQRERVLGPGHPLTAMTMSNLGAQLATQGRAAEALEPCRRALATLEAARGPSHPHLYFPCACLAEALERLGRFAEARPFRERALEVTRTARGDTHPEVAYALVSLGQLAVAEQRVQDGIAHYREALAIFEASFGPASIQVGEALTGLGNASLADGRAAEAASLLARAVKNLESGAEPGELAEARFALARALWDSGGDRVRARRLAEEARNGYVAVHRTGVAGLDELERWLSTHPTP